MYKAIAKCNNSYAIINEDTNEVEALDYKDLSIVLYFGVEIDGLAVNSEGDIIETEPLEVLSEADISDEEDYEDEDFGFDYEDELDDFIDGEEDISDEEEYFEEDEYEDYEDEYEDYDEDDGFGADWDEETYDLEPEFEETKVSKLHKIMNPAQVKLLKSYYLWFSRRLFTTAQKDPTFGMTDKARIAAKTADLDALRNSGGMWKYAGFIDTGFDGGGYCTLGHKLRYMHIAWDVTASDLEKVFFGEDYDKDVEAALDSEHCIIFGIKCVSDFFEVDKECMASLKKAQADSIKDMELMYDIYELGEYEKAASSFGAMDEIVKVLMLKETKKKLAGKESECIIDPALLSYYKQFRAENMIVPQSLVYLIRDAVVGDAGYKFTQATWYDRVKKYLSDTFKSRVDYIIGKNTSRVLDVRWNSFGYNDSITMLPYVWLVYWFCYKSCGYYEFNGDSFSRDGGRAKAVVQSYNAYKSISNCISDKFSVETAKKLCELYDICTSDNSLYKSYESAFDSGLYTLMRRNHDDFKRIATEWKVKEAIYYPHRSAIKSHTTISIQELIDKVTTTLSEVEEEVNKLLSLAVNSADSYRAIKDNKTGDTLSINFPVYREDIEDIEMLMKLCVSDKLSADVIVNNDSVTVVKDENGYFLYEENHKYWHSAVDSSHLEQVAINKRRDYIAEVIEVHNKELRELEEAKKREEEAKKREEEAKKREEEAQKQVEAYKQRATSEESFEVSQEEATTYLMGISVDDYKDKKGFKRYSWHLDVLKTLQDNSLKPTKKQSYYLNKLYEHITGNTVKPEIDEGRFIIYDFPDYLKAIKYVLSTDDSSFVSTVCKSVNKYGTFTEKQRKYLEEALQMYKDSEK